MKTLIIIIMLLMGASLQAQEGSPRKTGTMSTPFIKYPQDYRSSFLLEYGNGIALQVGYDTEVGKQYYLYNGDLASMKLQIGFRIEYYPEIKISFQRYFEVGTDILTDWVEEGAEHTLSICRKEDGIFREVICLGKFFLTSLDSEILYFSGMGEVTYQLMSAGGSHPSFSDIAFRLKPVFQSMKEKTPNRKIYIAGKITGEPVHQCIQKFETAGISVWGMYDPVEVVIPLQLKGIHFGIDHASAMNICLNALRSCDAIYMLAYWQDSPGAQIEHQRAKEWGLRIYYQTEP